MKFHTTISQQAVSNANYVVYMHQYGADLYVGYSKDAVNRYDEHRNSAFNEYCREYNSMHHTAMRNGNGKFFIVGIADTVEEAKLIEANAYQQFKPSLNRNPLYPESHVKLVDLGTLLNCTQTVNLFSRKNIGYVAPMHDRTMCHAKIVGTKSRPRVQSTGNGEFPAGLMIECTKSERFKYNIGDLVQIKVVMAASGKNLNGKGQPILPRQA